MAAKTMQFDMSEWIPLVLLSLFCLRSTAAVAADTEGGESPQAVFKAAQAAGAKKDYGVLVKLVAPSERFMLAFSTDMGVSMFVEFYEGEKADALKMRYQAVREKYGVADDSEAEGEKLHITQDTPQEVIDAHIRKRAERLYGHVNAAEYVPELMAIIMSMPEMAEESAFPQEELTNLQTEGDRATGKAGEKTISFVREGGRWYLTADIMN